MFITFKDSPIWLGWFFGDETCGYLIRKNGLTKNDVSFTINLTQEHFTASTSGRPLSMIKIASGTKRWVKP